MDCKLVEDLISQYIEDDVPQETYEQISLHLEQCTDCRELKEKIEEMLYSFPDLEEEVPFFLKNRLLYIPESQETEIYTERRFVFMKWMAAAIGTFVLFLNLFYFTNFYPPAHRLLHTAVAKVKTFAVDTGASIERMKESKAFSLFGIFKEKSKDEKADNDRDDNDHRLREKHAEDHLKNNPKKNGDKPGDKSGDKSGDKHGNEPGKQDKKSGIEMKEEGKNKKKMIDGGQND